MPCLRVPSARQVVLGALALTCLLASPVRAQGGLAFDSAAQRYVTFGPAPELGAATFTIEVWFQRTGTGTTASTGTGGVTAIPLLTKGRGQAENSNLDMNWFLGIRSSDNVLCADFEEAPRTGGTPGLNHPVAGVTPIQTGVWYHAAATYDGRVWRLYLNGNLETTLDLGADIPPRYDSIQHAALGTALDSNGTPQGYFTGMLDEPRVWNVARSQPEIAQDLLAALASGTGLVGRWGLDEGMGSTASNSVMGSPDGQLVNAPTWGAGAPFGFALDFGGSNAYVGFGAAPELGLAQFTLECWFRREGAGATTSTGTGGVTDAIPLLTKGRGEVDQADNRDTNWFLGLRNSDGVLVADFEEGAGSANPSLNHPVIGTTSVTFNQWHHAAASYDGTTWRLYLDGALEAEIAVGQPPRFDSIQQAALGSALTSTGVAAGFFDGVIDEARVWDHARTQTEIQSTINDRLAGGAAGLVARWGLDEGGGTAVSSSSAPAVNGTIIGSAWRWTGGAPFDLSLTPPVPPAAPTGLTASSTTWDAVELAWTDASDNETRFEIERSTSGPGGPFAPLATIGANAVGLLDDGLTALTAYCYRVRAGNGAGTSDWTEVACATTTEAPNTALDLGGSDAYVTFGNAAGLGLATFTLECWFRRDGAGTTANTGSGGVLAVPLLTHGVGEADGSNVDMNWFLGLRGSDGVLVADFEEGAAGAQPGLNHPVIGATPVASGVWHHAAATYDGTTWRLYLDGVPDGESAVGQPPRFDSIQHAGLGSALNSSGAASGFFDGAIDEARVWSVARSQAEILATVNTPLAAPVAGLVARWGLDEGSGTTVHGGAGTTIDGTVVGGAWAWTPGAPFNLVVNLPPDAPALVEPSDGATDVPLAPALRVTVSDPAADDVTVRWYGRAVAQAAGADFTLVGLPDTQYYTGQLNGGSNAMLRSQVEWIIDQRMARNIPYVVQLGDCTEHGQNGGDPIEWMRADSSLSRLEDPISTGLAEGIAYGICVGNHDQTPNGDADGSTDFYNQYFGVARFTGRSYYGGPRGGSNDNHFDLFEAGGLGFLVICLEYDTSPDAAVLAWADSLLGAYPDRKAIVATHNLIGTGNPGSFSTQGQAIYDALKARPNLILMLGGHNPGEGRRQDTFNGRVVHSLLADYQSRTGGGSGWLRLIEFSPSHDVIRVRTYSPWLDQWEADADSSSQFTLPCDLAGGEPFAELGQMSGVPSGGTVALPWAGRDPNTTYEWYVTVDDGHTVVTGPTWSFTTGNGAVGVDGPGWSGLFLAPMAPNPTRAPARIRFALPAAGRVRLHVFDVQGRLVARLADSELAGGAHELTWDGRGRSGRVASGIYFVRLEAAGHVLHRRLALVD